MPDNIILIITFIIALTGGVPGLIQIVIFLLERKKIVWMQATFMHGGLGGQIDGYNYFLMFSGSIINKGKKPIYPSTFDMYYKRDKKWVKLKPFLIPKEVHLDSEQQEIKFNKPWEKDLQRMQSALAGSEPMYGHLMYLVSQGVFEDFRKSEISKLKLICTDSTKKKHTCKFDIKGKQLIENGIAYPKIGIEVNKKH